MSKLNNGYLYKNKKVIKILKSIDFILNIIPIKKRGIPRSVTKILLLKTDHLGDMLLATAIFPLLQKHYPQATIDIVCQSSSYCILYGNPLIRNVYYVDHPIHTRPKRKFKHWLKFIKQYIQTLAICRAKQYDLCLLLRAYGGNLITLGRFLNPGCLIGYSTAGFGKLLDIEIPWQEGTHAVDHFLEVLKPLGIFASLSHLKCAIYPTLEDKHYVNRLCEEYKLEKFLVIHPFAGDNRKRVSSSIWSAIICKAESPIVICGSHGENLEEILPVQSQKVVNFIGKLTLQQLFLLFQKAHKIYTLDSISSHLAGLSGTPSTVFCKSSLFSKEWSPLGDQIEMVVIDDCPHSHC